AGVDAHDDLLGRGQPDEGSSRRKGAGNGHLPQSYDPGGPPRPPARGKAWVTLGKIGITLLTLGLLYHSVFAAPDTAQAWRRLVAATLSGAGRGPVLAALALLTGRAGGSHPGLCHAQPGGRLCRSHLGAARPAPPRCRGGGISGALCAASSYGAGRRGGAAVLFAAVLPSWLPGGTSGRGAGL
nr:hypothetical protein [Tanacetum cinerariifolium]